MKHKLYNRLLSLALAVGLVVGMLPGVTFASAVDSDATALQSQVEQIAEPTEEPETVSEESSQAEVTPTPAPEANAAPQAEARAQYNTVTVQYVDTNGSEIQNNSSEQINYSDDQEINVEAYAKDIPNYTFNHAEVDGTTIIAVRVKKSTGFFGNVSYNLQYKIDPEDWWQDEWNDWPNSWGRLSPLVLVYEKDAEPEPTPTPRGDVYITDSILTNGLLNAGVAEKLQEQVASYKWYRSETGAENTWEEVERNRVTGTEYNVNTDGTGLNAALDKYFAEPDDDTVRYYYYVEAFDANGSSLGKSDAYQVPYYDALQNGSFETPKANSWNNQLANGTPHLYWKTTGIAPAGKEGQDVEIIRYTDERFGNDSTYAAEVREAYGNIMKSDGTRGAEDGVQFAELNAEAMGALYQDVLTTPGSTLYWSLAHAARTAGGNNPPDQMQVIIAPAEEVKNITTQSQLLRFIATYPEYVQKPAGSDNEGIIASNQSVWTTYNGTYKVADGQYVTRFFFVSRSAGGEGNSLGNLLDDISFSRNIPEPDEDTGHLKVTKQVVGMDEIPDDYNVVIKVENEHYSIHEEYTFTKSSFTWDSAEQVWKASYVFQNLPVGTNDMRYYSVTEEVSGYSEDEFEFQERESIISKNVQVQAGKTVSAELKNVYLQDTSDEYPVRFYLEGIKKHQVTENYTFTDEWATLNADLIGGFANVTSTLYGGEDYPNLNGEAGYDSAVTGGSVSGGIRGHANVETWLEKYNCAPNIDTDNIANVLDDLIKMYPQIANVPVTVVGNEEYTVSEIKQTLQTDPDAFQIVYTQVTKNHDAITEHFRGNGSVTDGQDSYHVHLSIRKNPGDLTITKTFAGLDEGVVPENFAIEVKASNGTLIDTLTLDEATLKDDTYTWTLENLNEDIYTVTEINTDVDNKALNVAYTVTDSSDDTLEGGNTTSAEVFVANNETSKVNFTNTYTPANVTLTIKKNLTDFANNGKPVFSFKITDYTDGTVYYLHIDMMGKETDQDVLVGAIEVPAGHKYMVEELTNLNYKCTDSQSTPQMTITRAAIGKEEGTINEDTTVTFTNAPNDTKIPSDSGATQNNPDDEWDGNSIVAWKPDDNIKDGDVQTDETSN